MSKIAKFLLALTAMLALALAACPGNDNSSRSGARTRPASPGGSGTVVAKLPLRARKRGGLPE
jgi:hypothetical protein